MTRDIPNTAGTILGYFVRHPTLANLLLVMLLGGLWHGADWAFVLWGGIHGVFLVIEHAFTARWPGRLLSGKLHKALSVFSVPGTFLLVTLAWVPFRANGLDWIPYYEALFFGPTGSSADYFAAGLLLTGLLIVWCLPSTMEVFAHRDHRHPIPRYAGIFRWQPSVYWLVFTAMTFIVTLYAVLGGEPNEFIYFQF